MPSPGDAGLPLSQQWRRVSLPVRHSVPRHLASVVVLSRSSADFQHKVCPGRHRRAGPGEQCQRHRHIAGVHYLLIGLNWRNRLSRQPILQGSWNLGKWGGLINSLAIGWTAFIIVVLAIPLDFMAAKSMGGDCPAPRSVVSTVRANPISRPRVGAAPGTRRRGVSISRRDFLNGVLIAAGAALTGGMLRGGCGLGDAAASHHPRTMFVKRRHQQRPEGRLLRQSAVGVHHRTLDAGWSAHLYAQFHHRQEVPYRQRRGVPSPSQTITAASRTSSFSAPGRYPWLSTAFFPCATPDPTCRSSAWTPTPR